MCLLTFGGEESARGADPSLPKVGIFGEFGSARERLGALIELPYLAIAPFLAFRHRRLYLPSGVPTVQTASVPIPAPPIRRPWGEVTR